MTRTRIASLFIIGLLTFVIVVQIASVTTHHEENDGMCDDYADSELKRTTSPSELNPDRVEWRQNNFPNGGFEHWDDINDPDEIYTYTTYEKYGWYATAPWPVNEGSKSVGLQIKSNYPDETSEYRFSQQSQSSWTNPTNTTLRFDFYVDETPTDPTDWTFYLEVRLGYRYIYYYLGHEVTNSNSTSRAHYPIEGIPDTWNTFDRNITEDYIAVFSEAPTEYRTAFFYLYDYTNEYARVFLDDFWLINGTDVVIGGNVLNGNFEGGAGWYLYTPNDASFIEQSTDRIEGNWSLNATSVSLGNRSDCRFSSSLDERLTAQNTDTFQLWWKIDDWTVYDANTYAYVVVYAYNRSHDFTLYYPLAYGGDEPSWVGAGNIVVEPEGFNTTGTWFLLNTSIWDDIRASNQTDELFVEELEFRMFTDAEGARSVVLFDGLRFISSALNDRDYEDQGAVGEPIQGWDGSYESGPSPFTVTDEAFNGNKAANLTVKDGESYSAGQDLAYRPLNASTDAFLQFSWMLKNFTGLEYEEAYLDVYFDDKSIAYVFGNGSPISDDGEDYYTILLNPENETDTWFTEVRSLYHDYIDGFGTAPDTHISEVYLYADSDTNGSIEILFDDFYLYSDTIAPDVSITNPANGSTVDGVVAIEVSAYDGGSGVAQVEFWVEGTSEYNDTTSPFSYEWDTTGLANGTYSVTARAYDGAGNWAEVTHYYTISRTDTTTTTTTSGTTTSTTAVPPGDLTGILILVVVVGLIVVTMIFIYSRRRE